MKFLKYLVLTLITLCTAFSCAEADEEPIHTYNTIKSIRIRPLTDDPTIPAIQGEIDEERHEIRFKIYRDERAKYEKEPNVFLPFYIEAELGWDAVVTPALTGLHDFNYYDAASNPMVITVTAQSGEQRQYSLLVYVSSQNKPE